MGRDCFARRLALALSAAGLALVATLPAQERPAADPQAADRQEPAPGAPAAPGQQPVFRTGINFVRVDVIVTDKQGNPVSDLKQADFDVLEDGKPQKVETFRLVKVDMTSPAYTQRTIRTREDEEAAAADDTARIFVFFLDDYHVRQGSSLGVRRPLIQFIENQLSPNDLVSVMYPLTPLDAVTLTRNHQGVINTIDKFLGRKFDYEPRNDVERDYVYRYPTEVVEQIRRQVSLSALKGLSYKLGSLREGRKSIVLVSEGYTAMLPPQMRDQYAGIKGSGDNPARGDPFAAENNTNEDRARFAAEADLQSDLQNVFDAANRSNTAIYAVDPRGLSTGEFDIADNISQGTSQVALDSTMNTLRTLADNTDGRALVNRNDLAKGMQQIVRDSSAYYLLGYNSTQAPQDGKFHEIKVRLKRPGLQVRARKGYWALSDADVARALAPPKVGPPTQVTRALAAIAPVSGHRLVRTWIGTSSGADGKTKVTLVWEPTQALPGVRRDEARRVSIIASSPSGDTVYRGKAPSDLAPPGKGASISFDARPGPLQLRLVMEGDGTGTLDTEDRELAVPDLSKSEVVLGTPKVLVAHNAREFQALAADASAIPTALRDFRRTDRLLVRVDAAAPGTSAATVTARLLNQQGTKMSDIPITAPATAGQPFVVDLPLASLAAGQYLLELSAAADGFPPATELIAFRLGP